MKHGQTCRQASPGRVEGGDQSGLALRQRRQLERDLGDNSERAEAAHVKTGHVIPTNVLNDLSSAAYDATVGLHHFHPDDQVSRMAELPLRRSAASDGQGTAHRGKVWQGRIYGEELPVLCQVPLQLGHAYPRLDGGREIGGVVVHDAFQARQVEDPVEARGPVSNGNPGAASPRGYGEAVLRRLGEGVAKPLQVGQADGGRLEPVYRV